MKKTYLDKGFTLIELLVVIAIIGILSSIVLASLSTARSKANDSAVQEQLSGLRAAGEIYANGGSYGTFNGGTAGTSGACPATQSTANGIFGDVTSNSWGIVNGVTKTSGVTLTACMANGSAWVMAANLPSTAGTYWCVDSTGKSEKVTTATLTAGTFTAGALCP